MPRVAKPYYSDAERCWITNAVGDPLPSGRKRKAKNRDIGPPLGPDARKNERAAEAWLQGLLDEAAEVRRNGDQPTLYALSELYFAWARGPGGLAARTLEDYVRRVRKLLAFERPRGDQLGDVVAADLVAADLARFVDRLKADGYDPVYINSILITVQAMMNWAARPIHDDRPGGRILPANPFAGVARPKAAAPPKRYCGPRARAAFLEYAFLRACRQPVGSLLWRFDRLAVALFRFAEATGCRPDEACRLEWAHVDWEGCRAVLKGKSTGKTGRKRALPLSDATVRLLRAIEKLPGRHGRFVFTHLGRDGSGAGLAGVPWVARALAHKFRQWRDEAIEAGCPIEAERDAALTMYSFRRDLGADVLRDGGSYADVAEVLGNSAAVAERHYASYDSSHAVNLARKVEEKRRGGEARKAAVSGGEPGPPEPIPDGGQGIVRESP